MATKRDTMPDLPSAAPRKNLIIVLVEDHPKAILLLRMARKRATERNCKWRAVYVETPARLRNKDEGTQERILRLLTTAEQLGGESEQVEAASLEKGMEMLCAREQQRLDLVILGSTESHSRFSRFKASPWIRTVRSASMRTQVEIVPLSGPLYRARLTERLRLRNFRARYILYALASVGVALLGASLLERALPPALFRINEHNIALLFMTACAFAASRFGLLPGLIASVLSFLTVNYYYTIPYNTVKVDTVTDVLNMAIFLFAALLISLFTSQTRGYAENAAKRELGTQVLFTLYRIASEAFSRQQAIEKLQRRLERMLDVEVAFFMPPVLNPDRIEASAPENLVLSEADRKALEVCWRDTKTTGVASPYNPGTQWRFEPMVAASGEIGVIGVRPHKKNRMDAWFGKLLTAIADQTANILEHIELERSMEATRIREEREKLRSMLLSSVSHDLKTPLAGIIGALSVHQSLGSRLAESKRNELLDSSLEEAQRLDGFINNILEMTRLETGNITFKQEWHSAAVMVDSVCKRLRHRFKTRELIMRPIPRDIEAYMDVVMTEQVLQNILDNACKYTPEGTPIEVEADATPGKGFTVSVRDHGGGLPENQLTQVFDKYARIEKRDSQVAGTGLGLAISKAVMEAQGGWVKAENHPGGGAVFTFCLPQWRTVAQLITEERSYAVPK